MKWLDSWIFEGYRARASDLAVYRIICATYLLLTAVPQAIWIQYLPQAFFSPPPGLPALFTTLPPHVLVVAMNVLLAVCLSMLLVGWRTQVASVATSLVLIVLNAWEYSPGKINHDILLVLTPLVLAFSGWGDALSLDARRGRTQRPDALTGSWPLALLALLIGIAMFTGGWVKVSTGWLDPARHSAYGHFLKNYYVTGRQTWAAGVAMRLDSGWFWEFVDWSTTALELGFLLTVLHRRALHLAMAIACLFHLGVWQLFNILFSTNVLAYGAFVSYSTLPLPRQLKNVIAALRRLWFVPAKAIFVTAFLAACSAILIGRPYSSLLRLHVSRAVLVLGAGFSSAYLVALLTSRFKSVRKEIL